MEGAKRKIHRLRNSVSRRLSTSEDVYTISTAAKTANASSPKKTLSKSASQTQAQIPPKTANGVSRGIPKLFAAKKQGILEKLSVPEGEYSDKSPKGSVDEGVRGLVELVNAREGWVTTSSCAGRVSVFVEGEKGSRVEEGKVNGEVDGDFGAEEVVLDGEYDVENGGTKDEGEHRGRGRFKSGPGGKGGGKWLYVSHEPVPSDQEGSSFLSIFGLKSMDSSATPQAMGRSPRLIHLTFSPLILHVLSATLNHARPLLAAAINAGFRESGVQSLKALEDEEAGVTTGIRTAGLIFETVIGFVDEDEDGKEQMQSLVSEEYLKMCVNIINERFEWNEKRKDRLIKELEKVLSKDTEADGESEEERRQRKKEEGLKRQEETKTLSKDEEKVNADDVLEDGLDVPISK